MSVKGILDYLDEEVEKVPKKDVQLAVKDVIREVVQMALSRNFYPILREMFVSQKITEELFYEALWAYHRAKAKSQNGGK